MFKPLYIAILLIFSLGQMTQAQENQISTDRINITANTNLVKRGQYQMEAGYFLAKTKFGSFNFYYAHLPSTLQRYGLSDRIELRLGIISAAVFARNNNSLSNNYYLSGIEGPQLGAKFKLIKQKKLIPNISMLTEIKFQQLASKRFKSENLRPSVEILISHNLPAQITLGYNGGNSWDEKFYYSYNLYLQKKWRNNFITSINYANEWFAPDETGPNQQKRICSGLGYYFTDKIIADLGLGWGIQNAPDNFYKVGVSFGFKNKKTRE